MGIIHYNPNVVRLFGHIGNEPTTILIDPKNFHNILS